MTSHEHLLDISPRDIVCDPHNYEAGFGGNCKVLIGFHKPTKQAVAVKVAHGGHQDKALIKRTLKEEMEHLQKANHENIVRVLGWVEWEFSIGIVMEYCKGGNLRQLAMDRSIPLGVQLRLWLLVMIAKALAFCHSLPGGKRLLHCDVKPENSLLTEELVCKLGDFGTAELTTMTGSTTVDASAKSKKEKVQYTKYYTAPEKLRRPTMKPTKELDTYSFGIMMYMMLARVMPYPPNTPRGDIKQGLRPNCQEIEELKQTLNENDRRIVEELEQMMKECWDQDPSARPTMTEVSERLQQLLDQQDREVLKQQVAEAKRVKQQSNPSPTNFNPSVPLHCFSTRDEKFNDSAFASGDITQEPSTSIVQTNLNEVQQGSILPEIGGPDFITKYCESIEAENYEGAKNVREELSKSLQGPFSPDGDFLKKRAGQYLEEKRFWKAMLFYELATDVLFTEWESSMLINLGLCFKNAQSLSDCGTGMGMIVREMLFHSNPPSKQKIKRSICEYVIPLMHALKSKLPTKENLGDEFACLCETSWLLVMQKIEGLVGDVVSQEEHLRLGIDTMKQQFGSKAGEHAIYFHLLSALRVLCFNTSRLDEAEATVLEELEVLERIKHFGFSEVQKRVFAKQLNKDLQLIRNARREIHVPNLSQQ